ncbi:MULTISPECIES: division/cell wall cluster transcriptional repressor MraZ [unclassified Luteimonas]|uniref:division/cell wall cluster transcriptional repressor MraZ n=1 Tax=unclassified Luteimonas TaxID=2629088 RepID=UPI0016040C4A|nr:MULTISPECIES: division/cell wall cluster transcriptional repressor MraZ [unclassified Luteimonas]MBB1473752.1 division/cell wall cluster transcriptional repressor MraZ [Luteimonas sp. MC1782]MBB6600033.1 division/cell wall cluster transcriptional repressor MraZ [Luteimonas sp. MC1825]QOC87735.1 division/cell wall cluster transcriptional repressor MraZ [Luteimonas sp. MC1825]
MKPAADGHGVTGNVFQGETAITIDDKGRLAIPTSYRDLVASACANRLVVTYNPFEKGCLYLYPFAQWERVRDQVNGLSKVRRTNRELQLKLVGAAAIVEPDGNGRISIPASHRKAIGIEKHAVLLGMGDKFELWSEQAHREQIERTLGDGDLGDDLVGLLL